MTKADDLHASIAVIACIQRAQSAFEQAARVAESAQDFFGARAGRLSDGEAGKQLGR